MKRARPPMRRQASGHAHAASFGRQRLDTSLQVHFPVVQLLDPGRRLGRPVIAQLVNLPLERRALAVVTEQFQGPDASQPRGPERPFRPRPRSTCCACRSFRRSSRADGNARSATSCSSRAVSTTRATASCSKSSVFQLFEHRPDRRRIVHQRPQQTPFGRLERAGGRPPGVRGRWSCAPRRPYGSRPEPPLP